MQKIGMNPVSFKGILVHNCSKKKAVATLQSIPPFSNLSEEYLDNIISFEEDSDSVELSLKTEAFEDLYSRQNKSEDDLDYALLKKEIGFDVKTSLLFEKQNKKVEYTGKHIELFNIYRGIYIPLPPARKEIQ